MDLQLNEDQELLLDATSRFARERVAPGAKERDKAHDIPHSLIRELGEQGPLGVNLPEEFGGAEMGVVAYALAIREIARADASVAVTMAVTNMVGEVISKFGSTEQKEKYIPKLTSGEYKGGAFGLSEASAGSDPGGMRTRAVRKDGGWVLNGEKMWITTGDTAGVSVIWARTSDEKGTRGISPFLVEKDTPGFEAGKPEEKMGLRASHTVSQSLQDVFVPDSALLGEEGKGFKVAMMALDGGRIGIAAQSVGIGEAALYAGRDYALERKQFGKTLSEMQAIQFMLADMATELDAAWLLVQRAAWLKENAKPFTREASMAKMWASESANRSVRNGVQILGGYGYTEEYDVSRYYRDCRVTQIYEGTSEVQRLVIARDLLKTGI